MQLIENYNFSGKKAIVRVDFNVPLNAEFEVSDDTRIRGALTTIKKILSDGGSAILMSHLRRPKTGPDDKFSLRHVIPTLASHLGLDVQFANDCIGEEAVEKSAALKAGEVLILENLRFYTAENKVKTPEEQEATQTFAEKLSSYADVYVNDAFGTAHRAQASTHGIARFAPVACAGPLMAGEIEALSRALHEPARPLIAIVAGSKVSTKLTILGALAEKVDQLIVGGGIANTFLLAEGRKIGKSLAETDLARVFPTSS